MDYDEHVAATEAAVGSFLRALSEGPLDARVPTCPAWSVADLTDHVGGFCGFWSHVLCEGTGHPKQPVEKLSAGGDAVAWFEPLAQMLLGELHAAAPDLQVWTWMPDQQNAAMVARRSAHELSVHRYDLQLARGAGAPIDAAVAEDGIDEIFPMITTWSARNPEEFERGVGRGKGETLHLHGTDLPAEWLIELAPEGVKVRREHSKGDLAIRGSVSDLELLLYQRPTVGEVEKFGDESVLDAWYKAFTFG